MLTMLNVFTFKALSQFKTWMDSNIPDEKNHINPNLRKIIYCTAISQGDEKEWDFLWERLTKTNNANEKSNILYSLACTKHIWMLKVKIFFFISHIWYTAFRLTISPKFDETNIY